MNRRTTLRLSILTGLAAAMMLLCPSMALAFPADTYSAHSVLASGKWIKVSVSASGLHFISNNTLRSWGFGKPEAVTVHGYGGQRLSDRLTKAEYIDDLPAQQILRTASGIYFYAEGPESWTRTNGTNFYHTLNPFSSTGFYFLTDSRPEGSEREIPVEGFESVTSEPVTTFTDRLYHEKDLTSPGESGHLFVGEDFRQTRSQSFSFSLPGRAAGTPVWMRASFVANSSSRSSVRFRANGVDLEHECSLSASGSYSYATRSTVTNTFIPESDRLTLEAAFSSTGVTTLANLDAISLNYTRFIALTDGKLCFSVTSPSVTLAGADEKTVVWDVTDPLDIKAIRTVKGSGSASWTNTYSGERRYAAWNPGAEAPAPKYVGAISNQDLHASDQTPDMVIITVRDWAGEAERLARFHRESQDRLDVKVVIQDEIFNEFGSGASDVTALRRYLKMVYDRGNEAGRPLRYVLLFGRATHDNRLVSAAMKNLKEPFIPTWQSDDGLSVISSYTSDDPVAMLADNSVAGTGSSELSVALGRAPIHNLTDAKAFVDKVIAYTRNTYPTDWKNQVVMIADNGDLGVFMTDSERQYGNFMSSTSGSDMFYTKVYVDAFELQGGESPGARQRLHRKLDEGTMWLNYIGHGSINFLMEENVLSGPDIVSLYNRRWPLMLALTCSFGRHDGKEISGAERMLLNASGGSIASIAPTRESIISHNGSIAAAFGTVAFERDDNGRLPTIGEICQRAKNHMITNYGRDANNQKLYYVLLGDPALRLTVPESRIELEQIDGQEVTEENQCTIMARQRVRLTGSVYDPQGNPMDDFNGTISFSLYDAEFSTTSLGANTGGGKPTEGRPITFEEQGPKLYVGRDSVSNGHFDVTIAMPSEVMDNFRPAALNMYALADDGREASGCNRKFYVYGYDDSAEPDTKAPVIEYAYLNHESFAPGTTVNESPMFIARVSDDTAINLSTAGIGHSMTLKLDGSHSFNDVAFYFTPDADGSPAGTVAYPMADLAGGNHSMTFRVWDTSGNSTSQTLDFFVKNGAAPKLFDIYTDVNPASTEANFYITHNRPDAKLTVTLDIYDMLGHRVWTTTVTDRSDMFHSAPIHWDLTDMAGRRVQRGIYIYRATVSTDGHDIQSEAKRIAVTGQ